MIEYAGYDKSEKLMPGDMILLLQNALLMSAHDSREQLLWTDNDALAMIIAPMLYSIPNAGMLNTRDPDEDECVILLNGAVWITANIDVRVIR
jgi:hypothetical protein